ncbi:RHS repeat domain-containing protein [Aquimarina pacifica]|uniref:hypothetical protein n=1 Tax=Aquimarina pacifica TaxID=1296415 RepID=UPI00047092C6|nr:hypothetical protein [Aquimarina pacifica]
MNIIKNIWLLLMLCNLGAFFGIAQDNEEENSEPKLPQIIPPSPEVASLGKYVETPVNEFTGIPKIQIPIYEINQHRINHSINLSYHAQGVKVEEIASRVGMGWTLNVGGMIHRQKRSAPDEIPIHGYLRTTETVADFLNIDINHSNPGSDNSLQASNFLQSLFHNDSAHEVDFEPDLFTFSFGGYSGKFFFDQETQQAVFEETSPLKVEWIDFEYFKITTPDGLQYYFGENKARTSSTKQIKGGPNDVLDVWTTGIYGGSADETSISVNNNHEYVATWYLKEIYDPISDKSISFDYEEYNLGRLKQRLSSSVVLARKPYGTEVSYEHTLSEQYSEEYVLNQINFSNGRIEFIKDPVERLDLSGSHRLQQINIYSDHKIVKSFGLNHDMIQSTNSGSGNEDLYNFYSGINDRTYRLFLSSLKEYGVDKVNNAILYNEYKQYDFEYSNPDRLPHRFSSAQDFWGFHNNAHGNKNLLPRDLKLFMQGLQEIGEADRMINQDHSKDGVLTKITYPTGGYAEYIYENNRAKKDVNARLYYEGYYDPIYYDYETTQYDFDQGNASDYFSNNGHPYYASYFTLDDFASSGLGDNQLISFNYNNYNNYDQYDSSQEEPYWETFIQKYDESTNTWPNFSNREYNFNDSGNNEIALGSGQYRIVINWIGDAGTHGTYNSNYHGPDDWRVNFDVLSQTEFSNENYILAGGLRVKEIITNDLAGNIDTTKYLYKYENDDTTGNLVSLPYRFSGFNFYYYQTVMYSPHNQGSFPQHYEYYSGKKYSSDSSIALATTQSSYTGYDKVIKLRGLGEVGKTEYNFSFVRNSLDMDVLHSYPSSRVGGELAYVIAPVPLVNEELLRGKLLSKIDYNQAGDIIQEVTNTYELTTHDSVDAVNIGLVISGDYFPWTELVDYSLSLQWPNFNVAYVINKYQLFSRSNLLKEQTATSYDTNGGSPFTNTTTYAYDNSIFPNLQTGSATTNSVGEIIETKTYYPDDITSTTSLQGGALQSAEYNAIERLKYDGEEFRVGQPIQQETYIDGVLTAANRTNFRTQNNTTLPLSEETSKANANLEERLAYKEYDDYGNILEVLRTNGSSTMYVWGYNNTLPIAKLENVSYENLSTAQLSAIETVKVNADNDIDLPSEDALRIALESLRTAFPIAMVSTYTYDPLIGATSTTDPRGYTLYYEYDGFNRLQFVKDQDGNIISENQYHYKNN